MSDGLESAFPPPHGANGRGLRGATPSQAAETEAGRPALVPFAGEPPHPSEAPLPRWPDARAELPALRAQLARAEKKGDVERERRVAAALARALVKRRAELDIAVRLARRAVLLGDDTLRMELSSWHCQLGQTALAVGMLTPLVEAPGLDRARLLMRIALYWARLGQPKQALSALREAAAHDPDDPLVCELQAMVHGWAPESTSARQAADAYLQGAERRSKRGEDSQAFEDVLRAFDTSPESEVAAGALARSLSTKKGQSSRVDEVWRRHADALIRTGQFERGCSVHRRRMRTAIELGEMHRALAAAFDARLDASIEANDLLLIVEGDRAAVPMADRGLDWLLLQLGLSELFAARLQLAAEAAPGALASRCQRALGHFLESALGSTERALGPWMEAVVLDPSHREARASLRRYADATGDYGPLVESLVRIGLAGEESRAAVVEALRELARLVEERSLDVSLQRWALRRAVELEPLATDLARALEPLERSCQDADAELRRAQRELDGLEGDSRVATLRRIAAALQARPDLADDYGVVLWELFTRRPDELRWRRLLERLLSRRRDSDGLSRLWTRDLVSAADDNRALRALSGLSRLERRGGNLQGALSVLAADDVRGRAPAAAIQLSLAAQLGNRRLRAEGLLKYAATLEPTPRAWLASVASGALVDLGELSSALAAAEMGTRADPSLTRPIVAYADAAAGRRDRVAAVAYERAIAATFPSSAHCRGLVAVLDEVGEPYAAQVWTGRWLGLQPAETRAAVQLLHGAARVGDAARLGDVVRWAVSQAHPLSGWEGPLATALSSLAESDAARAGEIAWKVLDAFGPSSAALSRAVLLAAEQAGDVELQIAVRERELAADGASAREASLWKLATIHAERGDVDRCCAVLVRALSAGVSPRDVLSLLDSLGQSQSAEGEFHRLEARSRAHAALDPKSEERWQAAREHGAALWDLARDQAQAVQTWLSAAEASGPRAWFYFAQDLVEVLGVEQAFDEVCRLAESRDNAAQASALLTGAAVVCRERGHRKRALQLALLSLDTEPSNVAALDVIETASGKGEATGVERAYRAALGATLGRYGERALHYRAARFFERVGERGPALSHALAAFRAVPSEGVTFALMLRLAQVSGEAERACRVVEEVAAAQRNGARRSQWLRRAALIAGHGSDGAQHRTEVLLRALLSSPETETVDLLGRAFTDLARQQPDGRALGMMRFGRAVTKLIPTLESIDGARVAIAMAGVALNCFSNAPLALQALSGAVGLDPEADEFGELLGEAGRLAAEQEAASQFLDAFTEETDLGQRGSGPLLELATEVALGLGKLGVAVGLLTRRLERNPDDQELRQHVERLIRRCREPSLPEHVVEAFPKLAEHAQLLARAELAQGEGDAAAELSALEGAMRADPRLPAEMLSRLLQLAADAGQTNVAEDALRAARDSDVDAEVVLQSTRSLAASLIEHRRPQRALKILREACGPACQDVALLSQTLAAARAAGDDDARQEILGRLIESTTDSVKRSFWLNEAWEVAKKRGRPDEATALLHRWLQADPDDTQALSRLEAEYESKSAWEPLAELLARHLALGVSFRERRRLVLRRSELLERELGRLEEARKELSALVEQAPADRTVVERLASVTEQLGDHPAAASSWLTASGLSSTRPAAAQLAERACRLFLDGGDLLSARRVLAAPQTLPRTLGLAQLGVRLERDGENQPRLARALEELSQVEEQPTADRAAALLEAASLWRRLCDDERACQCASQAASWVPDDAEAQILASYLEYRRRGPTSLEEARRTVERLRPVLEGSNAEQLDMAGFLMAEALDQSEREGAGLACLRDLQRRIGSTPLVSIGLAERLSQSDHPIDALEHFDAALRANDLHGVRSSSELALAAARVAHAADLLGKAHRYAKVAETDPELSGAVAELRAQLAESSSTSGPPSVRAPSSRTLGSGPPRGRPTRSGPGEPGFAPIPAASDQKPDVDTRPARRTQMGLGQVKAPRRRGATQPGGSLAVTESGTQPPLVTMAPPAAPRPEPGGLRMNRPLPDVPRFAPQGDEESRLFADLEGGSAAAGHELCRRIVSSPRRAVDAVAVALRMLRLEPGAPPVLTLLRQVAEASGDHVYAVAVTHAAECLRPSERRLSPGALESQPVRPEDLRKLLFSDTEGNWPEALNVIWESTHRVLEWESVNDLGRSQRIRANAASTLARTYFRVARPLGLAQTPLFHLPSGEQRQVSVVYRGESSVLVRGEAPTDTPALRYDLGAALAGTLPAYVVVNAATYEQIDELFRAVNNAFGPPESSKTELTSTARLASLLWESVPPRTQRRMSEWCEAGKLTREAAVAAARRAARRAGLFASADLGLSLARLTADEGGDANRLKDGDALHAICRESSAAADLLCLACSPLFAHLRWRGAGGGGP